MEAKILNYFLSVLNHHTYITFPEKNEGKNQYVDVSIGQIKKGQLKDYPTNYIKGIARLQDNNDESQKHNKQNISGTTINNNEEEDIPIILVMKWLDKIPVNAKNKEDDTISLFYIKTKMRFDGSLVLPTSTSDVVWATCLECAIKEESVTFHVNEVRTKMNLDNWSDFVDSFILQYQERYNCKWEAPFLTDTNNIKRYFLIPRQKNEIKNDVWIIPYDPVTGTTQGIERLINHLIDNPNVINPLLRKMLGNKNVKNYDAPQLGVNLDSHCGMMNYSYPIADSQRHVVSSFNKLEDGDVLAVSGPPGTGKTTVLCSVVANLIVRHALHKENPPTILCSSANNKAITNIIDAFSIPKSKNNFFARWINFNGSPLPLAAYLPSNQKRKEIEKGFKEHKLDVVPFITTNKGGDNYDELKSSYNQVKDYLSLAESSGYHGDIQEIIKTIHEELLETYSILRETEDAYARSLHSDKQMFLSRAKVFFKALIHLRKNRNINSLKSLIIDCYIEVLNSSDNDEEKIKNKIKEGEQSLCNMESIDKLLDMSIRYKCFWLAVHYYEARWIQLINSEDRSKKAKDREDIFREMSFVCPCFVATFFRAPNCFKRDKYTSSYLINFFDLLIVDEAGQVSPEIGLPTFSLAKKAIVVGDEDQIPPIHSVDSTQSKAYWRNALCENEKRNTTDDELFKLLNCSNSSVMKVAKMHSEFNREWTDGQLMDGLFLDEHRRCYNEIIEYCNTLIYKKLKPMRGSGNGKDCLPVIAHYLVNHENSEIQNSGSRKSQDEIDEIIKWIKSNQKVLLSIYGKENDNDLAKIISIITPFKSQANAIIENLDKNHIKCEVGTVHTFQGAESPVVIYSTVYGSSEQFTFVDNNKNLMNVAVSRAKDHFFLFCSKKAEQLPENPRKPLNLLLYTASKELEPRYEEPSE